MFHQGQHAGFGQYGRFDRPLNFEALGKFGDLTPKVQRHLMQVYATLSSGLLAMALGVFLDYKFYVSGTLTQILTFAMIVGLTFVAGPVFYFCPYFAGAEFIPQWQTRTTVLHYFTPWLF